MLVALGESYEKLTQQVEAKKVRHNGQLIVEVCGSFLIDTSFFFLSSVTGGRTLLEM